MFHRVSFPISIWTLLISVVFFLTTTPAQIKAQNKTPSHVYQVTEEIVREIQLIRDARRIQEKSKEPGLQFNKLPLHVYAKSLEVKAKIARIEKELGLKPVSVGFVPVKRISPNDVFDSMSEIMRELQRLKRHWRINRQIRTPRLVTGKIPSDVYENTWKASYMLDGLVGAITPNHVYQNTLYVQQDLKLINRVMKVKSIQPVEEITNGRQLNPTDVLIESFKNLYRVSALERQIGIPPFIPPEFPHGKITPSQPYDTVSMLLAELARVKLRLNIRQIPKLVELPTDKLPKDVFAQVRLIGKNLEVLTQ